jgi:two-component system, NarL family, nitrate/nitrite response regulator NarL
MLEVSISNDTLSDMILVDSEPRSPLGSAEPRESVQRRSNVGVILVDSPSLIRAALGQMIQAQPDLDVVLEASSAGECVDGLRRMRRRTRLVAMVGLGLPGDNDSFWLIREIRDRFPTVPILASGSQPGEYAISRALFVGADGYVDKETDPPEFMDSIRQAARGELVLCGIPEGWLGKIADGVDSQSHARAILTEREVEILEVASEGLTARQIGHRLGVRERTVTTHLGHIYKKLGAGSRVAAIIAVHRSGLVTPVSRF